MEINQQLISILLGFVSFGLAFGIKVNHSNIKSLEERINNLHITYAKREDVQRDFKMIMDSLQRIEDQLQKKVDR